MIFLTAGAPRPPARAGGWWWTRAWPRVRVTVRDVLRPGKRRLLSVIGAERTCVARHAAARRARQQLSPPSPRRYVLSPASPTETACLDEWRDDIQVCEYVRVCVCVYVYMCV